MACSKKDVCSKTCMADKCDECYKELLRWNGIEGVLRLEIKEVEANIANAEEKLHWEKGLTPSQRKDWEYILYAKLPKKLEFLKNQLRGELFEYPVGKN